MNEHTSQRRGYCSIQAWLTFSLDKSTIHIHTSSLTFIAIKQIFFSWLNVVKIFSFNFWQNLRTDFFYMKKVLSDFCKNGQKWYFKIVNVRIQYYLQWWMRNGREKWYISFFLKKKLFLSQMGLFKYGENIWRIW